MVSLSPPPEKIVGAHLKTNDQLHSHHLRYSRYTVRTVLPMKNLFPL